ncbi:MAG: helix-hairpin-helix domain-containing protein [Bacteroidetes bacterium]|nr:helix-hairpin-helix domain-containing protein [Bacteroidota bacterium]
MENTWKDYFIFTRRDRNAAFILLGMMAVLIVLPYFIPAKKSEIHVDKELQREFDNLMQEAPAQNNTKNYYSINQDTTDKDTVHSTLFYFDPNTIGEDGLLQLGLTPKVVHTLINYRSKGGYFKKPEDIRKVYGLSNNDADKLIPYIRIKSSEKNETETKQQDESHFTIVKQGYKKININTATVEDWKAFPGIGDILANRIVKFRTSMGGFNSVEQVSKTYGLKDSIFQQIKPYLFLKDSVNNRK